MIAFGPIPSRRLGLSLGINNIVSQKVCSYSCVYCQIGNTHKNSIQRRTFYKPKSLVENVLKHLKSLDRAYRPDYLTFVSNGEPTLDQNLGREIRELKKTGIPVAVITNSSLLYIKEVRNELMEADWISVKVDTIDELAWKRINRPTIGMKLDTILNGLEIFTEKYNGLLNTETMLVENFNDIPNQIKQTALYIAGLKPSKAYLSVPTRPPAVKNIAAVSEKKLAVAWQIFRNAGLNCELLTGFEGTDTGFTGNAFEDILNITAVHPLREDTINKLIIKEKADLSVVDSLIFMGLIKKTKYNGMNYYLRSYHF